MGVPEPHAGGPGGVRRVGPPPPGTHSSPLRRSRRDPGAGVAAAGDLIHGNSVDPRGPCDNWPRSVERKLRVQPSMKSLRLLPLFLLPLTACTDAKDPVSVPQLPHDGGPADATDAAATEAAATEALCDGSD
jgi:hypothetical protein